LSEEFLTPLQESQNKGEEMAISSPASNDRRAIGGKYLLMQLMSQSPRAQVFLSESLTEPKQNYAIKLFNTVAMSVEQRQRMEKEIDLAIHAEHPYLVSGIEAINSNGLTGYVMEYAPGGSLRDKIDKGSISEHHVIRIAAQLCSGLNALHSLGIVHRNLRPSTILFDNHGDVRITNFGIVREHGANRLTEHKAVLGAAEYVSPEYLETGMLDRRSDIYALGTLLYEMVTGRVPFAYPNPVRSLQARLNEEPTPPQAFAPACSEHLQSIILRALARNPFSRYESGTEMLEDLLAFSPTLDVMESPCPDEGVYQSSLFIQEFSFDDAEEDEEDFAKSNKVLDWSMDAGIAVGSLASTVCELATSEEAKHFAQQSLELTKRVGKVSLGCLLMGADQCVKFSGSVPSIQVRSSFIRAACILLLGVSVSILGYRYAGTADKVAPQIERFVSQIAEELSEPIAAHAKTIAAHAKTVVGDDVKGIATAETKAPAAPKIIRR